VSNTFVSQERAERAAAKLTVNADSEQPRVVKFITKHGSPASMTVPLRTGGDPGPISRGFDIGPISRGGIDTGPISRGWEKPFSIADLKSLVASAEKSLIDRTTASEMKRLAQKLLKIAERALHRSAKHTRKVSRQTS
jgi:hypothetical protein